MGIFKGGALRLVQTALYFVTFCCSAIILGFFSYFLAVSADRNLVIPAKWKAVEGMAGAAVLYSIAAILFTCCLGGVTFFAFLGLALDVLFVAAMVAIAIITRDGAHSCSGTVVTPIGTGPATNDGSFGNNGFGTGNGENTTFAVGLGTACRYNKVSFAVAIIGALFFLFTALMQVFLARHHKKEKRYGPGPKNNYTSGTTKRKFWQRRPKGTARDAEMTGTTTTAGGLAVPVANHHDRASHETGYTGSTVAAPGATNAYDKDATHSHPHNGNVNPYGYNTPATQAYPATGTTTNY